MQKKWWLKVPALVTVIAVAVAVRALPLTSSLTQAEAENALAAATSWTQLSFVDHLQPPLMRTLIWLALRGQDADWWLRTLVTLLPSLLTIAGVYALGHKLANKKVGLAAALLLTLSTLHLATSTQLQPTALTTTAFVWSWFFLLEAVRVGRDSYQLSTRHPLNRWFKLFPISRDFFLYLAVTILGLYTSYLYLFAWLAQVLFLTVKRQRRLGVYTIIIPTVAFLPWLGSVRAQVAWQAQQRQVFPGWEQLLDDAYWRGIRLTPTGFLLGPSVTSSYWTWLLTGAIIIGLLVLTRERHHDLAARRARTGWVYFFLLVCPAVLAWLAAFFWAVAGPAHLLYLVSALELLTAHLLFAGARKISWRGWVVFVLVLASHSYGSAKFLWQRQYEPEPWRAALTQLHARYDAADTVVVFAYPQPLAAWQWYERHELPGYRFPTISANTFPTGSSADLESVLASLPNYHQVILVDYWRALTDPSDLLPSTIESFGFQNNHDLCYAHSGCFHIYAQPFKNKQLERPA